MAAWSLDDKGPPPPALELSDYTEAHFFPLPGCNNVYCWTTFVDDDGHWSFVVGNDGQLWTLVSATSNGDAIASSPPSPAPDDAGIGSAAVLQPLPTLVLRPITTAGPAIVAVDGFWCEQRAGPVVGVVVMDDRAASPLFALHVHGVTSHGERNVARVLAAQPQQVVLPFTPLLLSHIALATPRGIEQAFFVSGTSGEAWALVWSWSASVFRSVDAARVLPELRMVRGNITTLDVAYVNGKRVTAVGTDGGHVHVCSTPLGAAPSTLSQPAVAATVAPHAGTSGLPGGGKVGTVATIPEVDPPPPPAASTLIAPTGSEDGAVANAVVVAPDVLAAVEAGAEPSGRGSSRGHGESGSGFSSRHKTHRSGKHSHKDRDPRSQHGHTHSHSGSHARSERRNERRRHHDRMRHTLPAGMSSLGAGLSDDRRMLHSQLEDTSLGSADVLGGPSGGPRSMRVRESGTGSSGRRSEARSASPERRAEGADSGGESVSASVVSGARSHRRHGHKHTRSDAKRRHKHRHRSTRELEAADAADAAGAGRGGAAADGRGGDGGGGTGSSRRAGGSSRRGGGPSGSGGGGSGGVGPASDKASHSADGSAGSTTGGADDSDDSGHEWESESGGSEVDEFGFRVTASASASTEAWLFGDDSSSVSVAPSAPDATAKMAVATAGAGAADSALLVASAVAGDAVDEGVSESKTAAAEAQTQAAAAGDADPPSKSAGSTEAAARAQPSTAAPTAKAAAERVAAASKDCRMDAKYLDGPVTAVALFGVRQWVQRHGAAMSTAVTAQLAGVPWPSRAEVVQHAPGVSAMVTRAAAAVSKDAVALTVRDAVSMVVGGGVGFAAAYACVDAELLADASFLRHSAMHDAVTCVAAGDLTWDGQAELLVGTFDCRLLAYTAVSGDGGGDDAAPCDGGDGAGSAIDADHDGGKTSVGTARPRYDLVWERKFAQPLYGVAVGDFNDDGVDELLVVTLFGVHLLGPPAAAVLRAVGDGVALVNELRHLEAEAGVGSG